MSAGALFHIYLILFLLVNQRPTGGLDLLDLLIISPIFRSQGGISLYLSQY